MNFLKYTMALLLFISAACSNQEQRQAPEEYHEESESSVELTSIQYKTAGIALGKVEQKQISGTIKVNGVLDVPPQQLVSVSIPLGGFLKNTALLQGSKVRKGQVIATVENPEYITLQQDYLEAKSNLEFATADYERQQQLAKENVNARKTLQQSKRDYQVWLAKVNGLKATLKMINIDLASLDEGNIAGSTNFYSPISGYVTEVSVNIGKYVNPTDVLFEIVDTQHLHAELTVFEKDVPKLKLDQKVRFTLANETKERMATVYLIGREISADRSIRIHCHLDEEDTELLPGMFLKAIVEMGGTQVAALPDEAIVDFQGRKYIFVPSQEAESSNPNEASETEDAYHYAMVEVQTGYSDLGFTEVMLPENIDEDSEIVIKGAYSLLSKMKNSEEEGHGH